MGQRVAHGSNTITRSRLSYCRLTSSFTRPGTEETQAALLSGGRLIYAMFIHTPTSASKARPVSSSCCQRILCGASKASIWKRPTSSETARARAKLKATPQTPQTSSTSSLCSSPLVLFASAVIDYDYIMGLIARFSAKAPGKATMSREELIGTLKAGEGLSDAAIAAR